jgi:hypothetical protein
MKQLACPSSSILFMYIGYNGEDLANSSSVIVFSSNGTTRNGRSTLPQEQYSHLGFLREGLATLPHAQYSHLWDCKEGYIKPSSILWLMLREIIRKFHSTLP